MDLKEEMSEEEYEIIDLEAELHGINEGFRIASEKLEAIKEHRISFSQSRAIEWIQELDRILEESRQ